MSHPIVQVRVQKRSISYKGKKTSISLEDPFWERLKLIAASCGQTVSALIAEVIRDLYKGHNISSACRLYVLSDALGERRS